MDLWRWAWAPVALALAVAIARRPRRGAPGGNPPQWTPERFPPNSDKLTALLLDAASAEGLPPDWAGSPDLHYIIQNESGGWVGRPNYWFGRTIDHAAEWPDGVENPQFKHIWPDIWRTLQERIDCCARPARKRDRTCCPAKSTALGIGQLTSHNMLIYTGGLDYGNPLAEARGMLAYIADRYGTPQEAARFKRDQGWY